jgi:hypothetical protein
MGKNSVNFGAPPPIGVCCRDRTLPVARRHPSSMFVVTEEDATATSATFEREGELSIEPRPEDGSILDQNR